LTTFADLTTLKLRITGTILNNMITSAGGHPVTINEDDIYQAIQRGTIDGSQSAMPAYLADAWYEVAKYMSAWPMGCNAGGIIINPDVWNSLGPDLQKILQAEVTKMENNQWKAANDDIATITAQCVAKGAIEQDPSQAEKDKLLAFVGPAIKNWANNKVVGVDNATKLLAILNKQMGTNYTVPQ
jgi:TRAP-type C4-dicarboxylate transport system substrate-binding protein